MSRKKPVFSTGQRSKSRPSDPEAVFADLRPREETVKHLWSHQADIIRSYHRAHRDSRDVALELPTGMGKTLVGLLIAEWRRAAGDERVLYLCPTRQLAKQVARQALGYGLNPVLLVGPQNAYLQKDYARYAAAEAVGITTYKGIFNTNPRLNDAQALILDDAHSGGDQVADMWSLSIPRALSAYRSVVELYADVIPRALFMRLLTEDVDPRDRLEVYKVPTAHFVAKGGALTELLNASLADDLVYSWRTLRDHIPASHLYVSWYTLLVRPLIPPTLAHPPFAGARQRVYMSATLGAGGELERLMGVQRIERIPVPETWESQRTGRRFVLFPSFSLEEDKVEELITRAVEGHDRTLIICPSNLQANRAADLAAGAGVEVLGASEVEDSLEAFSRKKHAALVVAARYDGIDLPDSSCRQLMLIGRPSALDLQERFYTDKLRADPVLRDRVRTRITQGAGRCTRNPSDYAAVLLCGTDLLDFCLRRENREGMARELQAEVRFGLENSAADSVDDVMVRLEAFFEQGETWRLADEAIRELRQECTQVQDPIAGQLNEVVPFEVRYGYALWDGAFEDALQLSREVADRLSGEELRSYRAWWLYLAASAAAMRGGVGRGDDALVRELLERARAAAGLGWIRSIPEMRPIAPSGADLALLAAENSARQLLELGLAGARFETRMKRMQEQLRSSDPGAFHAGLSALGELLGFVCFQPEGSGTPDVIWRLEPHVALVWEAKSQAGVGDPVSVATARQCVGHAGWAKESLQLRAGEECYVIAACHRAETDRAAVAQAGDTRLYEIGALRDLGDLVIDTLRRVRAKSGDALDVVDVVREELTGTALEPRRLVDRLTAVKARDVRAE